MRTSEVRKISSTLGKMCTRVHFSTGMVQHFKTGGLNAGIQEMVNYTHLMHKQCCNVHIKVHENQLVQKLLGKVGRWI